MIYAQLVVALAAWIVFVGYLLSASDPDSFFDPELFNTPEGDYTVATVAMLIGVFITGRCLHHFYSHIAAGIYMTVCLVGALAISIARIIKTRHNCRIGQPPAS